MNTLLFTAFMMMNPGHGSSTGLAKAQRMDQVNYNHFNYNFQVSIKLRFDGKKRRDGLRISF